jgi:hypothetical protein
MPMCTPSSTPLSTSTRVCFMLVALFPAISWTAKCHPCSQIPALASMPPVIMRHSSLPWLLLSRNISFFSSPPTLAATYESTCFTLTFLWYNASSVMHKDKNCAGGLETIERTRSSLQKSSKVLRVGISFFYYPCPLNKKDSVTTKSTESNSQKLSFQDSILLHSKNIGNKQKTKLS